MNDSSRLAPEKHQRGFPDQAAQLDLKVLSREPEHAEALHLLGVVAHQQGRHAQAIGISGSAGTESCRQHPAGTGQPVGDFLTDSSAA
jgi:hypothetical protein